MYQVVFTKVARKRAAKLDKRYASAFDKAINKIAQDPECGETLQGALKGYWKVKFSRYRIIYKIQYKKLIVILVDVGHRKEVYR